MTPNPDSHGMEEELRKVLVRFGSEVYKAAFTHSGWSTALEDEALQSIESLIERRCKEARIDGFRDAQVACSFNENCDNCRANKLTLGYLGEPHLFAPAADNDGGRGKREK